MQHIVSTAPGDKATPDRAASSTTTWPGRARVVIIGGGVIGTSIAYHLAKAGERDVVLLERDQLTCGTTWHAAGLMTTFGSLSQTTTALRLYSRDLYAALESETGLSTGFRPVGLIEAAADPVRLEEYRRVAAVQAHLGLEVHEIGPADIADRFPWARTDDLLAGFWVPGDGRVNPVDLTMSLAKGARARGVQIREQVRVLDVLTTSARVTGVRTQAGDIDAEVVVNAAGMWARELGERQGVVVPNQAAEHYYLITDAIAGIDPDGPIFEDPASYGYYREEGGGMMVGLFEPRAAPWSLAGVPDAGSFRSLPPDWDRMAPYVQRAMDRVPITKEVGIRRFFCGPESFTADLAPIVGESATLDGYFVCAGLNSVGVLSAGGLGRIMAHWIIDGHPDVDITGFDARRTRTEQVTRAFRADRLPEILGTVYAAHPPNSALASARGIKRSPLHSALTELGAQFVDTSGWESPTVFSSHAPVPGWGPQPWWPDWRAEHEAVRASVGLLDMSFMAKFLVSGSGAATLVDWLSTAPVAAGPGRVTYTAWLDEWGMLTADVTVSHLAKDRFLVVASDTSAGSVFAQLQRGARQVTPGPVTVADVTGAWALLSVQGPNARDLLAAVSPNDLSPQGFAFRDARWVEIGMVAVWAQRISYVGELGWELFVPVESAAYVHDVLVSAGADLGLRHVGLSALASLRLEKGYRDFGHDIDNTDDPYTAGLGFVVALDKPGGFRGHESARAVQAQPRHQRLISVLVPQMRTPLVHGELLNRDGAVVGLVRSGSFGWTLGGAVGLAMVTRGDASPAGVDRAWLASGVWTLEVAGRRYAAQVSLTGPYDPASLRAQGGSVTQS
ncbi:MAG: FAD-dependent oxidoreductase [Nostocoides sp.]